jgi:hypothetical protein
VSANPISVLEQASGGLMEGRADGSDILVVAAVLTAVFMPLTTRLSRKRW